MSESTYVRNPDLLSAATSRLVVVDMQERFIPTIRDSDKVIANCVKLLKGAGILDVPASATEQYPKGLGSTVPDIAVFFSERPEKLRFSCAEVLPWVKDGVGGTARHQIVLCGIEAHVCVLQTAFDLMSAGFDVYVAVDAVGDRVELDQQLAIQRMRDAGVRVVSTEMVLFEWCEIAGTDKFKQISKLVTGR